MLLKGMMLLVLEFHGLLSGRNENGPRPPSQKPSVCLHAEPRGSGRLVVRQRGRGPPQTPLLTPGHLRKEATPQHLSFPTGDLAPAGSWALRTELRGY